MQLYTLPMPRLPPARHPQLLLRRPRHALDDPRDEACAAVRDEVEPVRLRGGGEEGEEERIGIGSNGGGDVFLVEDVVQERGWGGFCVGFVALGGKFTYLIQRSEGRV